MSTRGIELKFHKALVGWRGDVLPFLVEGASAPRAGAGGGGVGRWGRMAGRREQPPRCCIANRGCQPQLGYKGEGIELGTSSAPCDHLGLKG